MEISKDLKGAMVSLRLSGIVVTLAERINKKNQLVKTRTDLIQKRNGFGKKADNWIEPLREWINDAYHAEELASSKDLSAIKSFVGKIGTNRRLLDRKVLMQWENPWELLAERDGSSDWLGTLNTFRTKYYYQIIELSPQIEVLNVELRTA